jgi:hypothetical protein
VAIQANTVYIASFSSGGGLFGVTTNFFTSGGVTNGPLEALPNSVAGGDGVYSNRTSAFPNVDSNGLNFWADVAFTPSSSGDTIKKGPSPAPQSPAVGIGGFGMGALTSGQSNRLPTPAPAATPAGPARYIAGPRGTTPAVLGSSSYRRTITQAATFASLLKKSPLASGSV